MRLLPLPGVFQPISDSRWLAEQMIAEGIGPDTKLLDLCTGSGFVAVSGALNGAGEVTAIDVSRRAIASVRVNAKLNRVHVLALRGDLFEPVRDERFDLIVSNPPYVPSQTDVLPTRGPNRAWDAGRNGRAFIDRICACVADHLNPGGVLLMVQNTLVGERETLEALAGHGLEATIAFRHLGRLGPRLRELKAQGRLHSDQDEVLIVRAENHQWTPRIKCASATCSVEARSSTPFSPRAAAESGNTL